MLTHLTLSVLVSLSLGMEETPLTLEQVEHIPTIPRELSSVRIREFDESTANPEPIVQDDEADHLLEEFLSPAKLVSAWWITTEVLRTGLFFF